MRFELRYPHSFRRLLALGLSLVALPLVIGLVSDAVSLRRIAAKSERAVYQASRLTQASRVLLENVAAQERTMRQFLVLGDPALREAYGELHLRFKDTASQFAANSLDDGQSRELAALVDQEEDLFADLGAASLPPSAKAARELREDVARRFVALSDSARVIAAHNASAIDSEIEQLREIAEDSERMMLWQLLALLPVAIFLVLGFTRLLAGPIAQLAAGIGGLRSGRLDRNIEVGGPSDLNELGEGLNRLRLRLINLEEQKSRFLHHVSHELKTPLTALHEGSSLLADRSAGPLTPAQSEIVKILTDNSQRLRALIESLLSHSAAEFAQTALRRQVFPLRELVASVVEAQRLAWRARELTVDVDVPEIALNADRERVRTVLDNLLSNAVKFSPERGRIGIAARVDGGQAVIEVGDDGPGIPDEDRERIFDPFYQGRTPAAGPVKSSGLGLSIAMEHVLAHGGRLALLPGSGARFEVRLPLQ